MLNKTIRVVDTARLASNMAKLPEKAYHKNTLHCTGPYGIPPLIGIKKGDDGYHPIYVNTTAEALNEGLGVTKAQAEAMLNGSLFGWDTPSADPDNPCNKGVNDES